FFFFFFPTTQDPRGVPKGRGMGENMEEFKKTGVCGRGFCSVKTQKRPRFSGKVLLNFTLLSDEDHQVCEQFGVWGEKSFMGKTYDGIHRISFLIDDDGKIEHVFDDFKTSNHHDVVLNWLKEHT
ncbi:thioredoxin-dependent thiol peroxidase, partial [Escherichia coli]|nr:thioredoxin-dependent thiol peroxidase [Escherichia coli]